MKPLLKILAVGSPHGDDQVGWRVADLLRRRGVTSTCLIQNVDEVLWHLSPDSQVILIDACLSGAPLGSTFRFQWPDPRISHQNGVSTHGIDISYVLRMAENLGRIPREVVIYAIEIRPDRANKDMSGETEAAARATADQIMHELAARGLDERCMNDP